MGCGHNKRSGYVNVDLATACAPDIVCDLESLPWPWPDNSVDEVVFNHSLEHLGQNSGTFLGIIKELYRICRNNAKVEINVPHPRHDNFLDDPTHVRAISPALLSLFDRDLNDEWKRVGVANTPLAHYLDVDFRIVSTLVVLSEPYSKQYEDKVLSDMEINVMIRERNNIASEHRIVIVAGNESEHSSATSLR
jgi:hypothetical protein